MLMLSKKVEYGLIAMLHMASLKPEALVTAKEISETYNIPTELMGKVLQALAKAGLAEAVHGSKGGYYLSRALSSVQLGDVIEAVEGPVHLARCQEDPASCGQYSTCTIKEPIQQINEQLQSFIFGISLSSLAKPEAERGVMVEIQRG